MRRTEDLIDKFSRDRRPQQRIWPAYPLLPLGLTFVLSLILPKLMMGDVCHAFAGPSLEMPMWAPGAIIALVGAGLALRLASPTEGGAAEVVLVAAGTVVTLTIWPWGADAMKLAAFLHALALNGAVAVPGLALSLFFLRRGASLHPFRSGLGAGFAMGGIAMAVLMALCDGLAMPDRLAAAWVCTWALGILGGLLSLRILRW